MAAPEVCSELSLQDKFKRFVYVNSPHCLYITGNPERHAVQNDFVAELAKTSSKDFLQLLKEFNEDPLLPRRQNIFYVLAIALTSAEVPFETKQKLKEIVLKLCKTDEEFFDFIKYHTELSENRRKISKRLRKIITQYYSGKSALELAECVRNTPSCHGWTHKDLFKLCHIKEAHFLKRIVVEFVLFGAKKVENQETEDGKRLVDILRKGHEMYSTSDPAKAAQLVTEFHSKSTSLNPAVMKNELVWAAIIPHLAVTDVLRFLTKLYKLSLLKPGTNCLTRVIEALTNADRIKACNLHPVQVFIHLKNFQKGGKAVDPKLLEYFTKKELKPEIMKKITTPSEPKCQAVITNINKCLIMSYSNLKATEKKIMVTIDATKRNNHCMHNKNISTLEAIYAITRCLSKVEKNVTVAVFEDTQISLFDITKSYSMPKFMEQMQETKGTFVIPNTPFEWASTKKKQFDVFINFLDCDYMTHIPKEHKEKIEKPHESLNKYCDRMKSPDTKLVRIFLGGLVSGLQHNHNILTICGFTEGVPKVLEAFIRGRFC